MSKTLFVGDMHVVPEELKDSQALISYALDKAVEHDVSNICFLGDQYHTHGLIRLEVQNFWVTNFKYLAEHGFRTNCLVGNHDRFTNSGSSAHSMAVHHGNLINVIDKPQVIDGNLYVPFCFTPEEFVKACNDNPTGVVICHQTLDGSKWENGYYSEGGVDVSKIPQDLIISGHIHTSQTYLVDGKEVIYIGSPRWRIKSDENVDKQLVVVDWDSRSLVSIDTSAVCSKLVRGKLTPDSKPLAEWFPINSKDRFSLDVEGPAAWVDSVLPSIPRSINVRAIRKTTDTIKVRESDGIEVAYKSFLDGFEPPHGTSREILALKAKQQLQIG